MRKLIWSILVMTLVMTLSVTAGSISGLDYNDCTEQGFWWWSDQCWNSLPSTINDGDVNIDADTLEGQSASDIKYYADINDAIGGGISTDTVVKMLTGNYDYEHDYDTYNSYMLVQVTQLLINQQDMMICMMQYGYNAALFDLKHCTARRRAERAGEKQYLDDGYICGPKMCIKFYEMPTVTKPTESQTNDGKQWKTEALAYWDLLCDQGMQKWCLIAQQNRIELGLE